MPVKYIEQFYEIFLASVGNRTNPSTIKEFTFSLQKKAVPMRPRETWFPFRAWFTKLHLGILLISIIMAATVENVGVGKEGPSMNWTGKYVFHFWSNA